AKDYQYVLMPATTFGKNILPRVAAKLDQAMIADVMHIISKDTFVRPIYAGNALATVQSNESIQCLTIRTTAFKPTLLGENNADVVTFDTCYPNTLSQFVGHELSPTDRPELTSARIIVSGGRGLKNAENFKLI